MNKELDNAVDEIISLYDTDEQREGIIGNTRWRVTGLECKVDICGQLQLADDSKFDRWANSVTVTVGIWGIYFDGNNPKEVIKKALTIY